MFKPNKKIFPNKDNLLFYVADCPEKKDLEQLIISNGGLVSETPTKDSIVLVPSKEELNNSQKFEFIHTFYYNKFVIDSVSSSKMLPIKDYQVRSAIMNDFNKALLIEYANTHPGSRATLAYWKQAFDAFAMFADCPKTLYDNWKALIKENYSFKHIALFKKDYDLALNVFNQANPQ